MDRINALQALNVATMNAILPADIDLPAYVCRVLLSITEGAPFSVRNPEIAKYMTGRLMGATYAIRTASVIASDTPALDALLS